MQPIGQRKLGKRPPISDKRTLRLATYLLARPALPVAPSYVDWCQRAALPWGLKLNDQIGDCTCAAAGHAIQVFLGNAGNANQSCIPTDDDVLAAYKAAGGYDGSPKTDRGAAMLDVLKFWRKVGIGGRQIGAFVQVDTSDMLEVQFAAWHFEGVYCGLNLPESAQDGGLWDVPKSGIRRGPGKAGSWGGHARRKRSWQKTRGQVMTANTTNLIANIIKTLPANLQGPTANLAAVYGRLTLAELQATWALVIAGDTEAPLKLAVANMTADELDADGAVFTAQVQADAQANADSVAAQKSALKVVASTILTILLAAL
jgi:hypothetical protein